MKQIILIGGGGHCKSVIEVIESTEWQIKGILDKAENKGLNLLGYPYIGTDDDIEQLAKESYAFHITVGHIKSNEARVKLYNKVKQAKGILPTIIASTARVSKHAQIGEGSIIMHHAFVNAATKIGNNCIINTGTVIEHDAQIGNHCHISTGAYINGNVIVNDNCFVGSQSTLANGISVIENTIIGAGSVVIADIGKSGIYVGNPTRLKN